MTFLNSMSSYFVVKKGFIDFAVPVPKNLTLAEFSSS